MYDEEGEKRLERDIWEFGTIYVMILERLLHAQTF
jgi:hypothetical protein